MKVSVSIPEDDLRFIDQLTAEGRYASRSAAVTAAIRGLRDRDLEAEYTAAFDEWEAGGEAALWETTVGDGLE